MKTGTVLLLTVVCIAAGFASATASEEFHLVTPEEHTRERAEGQARESRPVSPAGAPTIEVVAPKDLSAITVPVSIDIRFTPQEGRQVDVNSLHVLYGWLEIDITDRIRKYCEVTAVGIKANKAKLPPGSHRLTVKIADTNGLVGSKDLFYHVVEQ
jgi:hypothetical protein